MPDLRMGLAAPADAALDLVRPPNTVSCETAYPIVVWECRAES